MYSRLFCIVLLCIVSSEKFFVSGLAENEGEKKPIIWDRLINRSVVRKYINEPRPSTTFSDCDTLITEPGRILKILIKDESVRCKWPIQAPEGQRVAVYFLDIHPLRDGEQDYDENNKSNYYEDLNINIYDGSEITAESTQLFSLQGPQNLNEATSSERNLIIDLDYTKPKNYDQQILFQFRFIEG